MDEISNFQYDLAHPIAVRIQVRLRIPNHYLTSWHFLTKTRKKYTQDYSLLDH